MRRVLGSSNQMLRVPQIGVPFFLFHILVLRPTTPILDTLLKQIQDPPPLVKVDGEDKYFIKRINNIKYNK